MQVTSRERRGGDRYRLELELQYRLFHGSRVIDAGTGRTYNLSRDGVFFETGRMLEAGAPVELSIRWPVLLMGTCPVKLVISGSVARSDERGTAVKTSRYEFRTAARSFPSPAGEPKSKIQVVA